MTYPPRFLVKLEDKLSSREALLVLLLSGLLYADWVRIVTRVWRR